jgi:hypothetical protein
LRARGVWVGNMSKEGAGSVCARGVDGLRSVGGLPIAMPMAGTVSVEVSVFGDGCGCWRRSAVLCGVAERFVVAAASLYEWGGPFCETVLVKVSSEAECLSWVGGVEVVRACRQGTRSAAAAARAEGEGGVMLLAVMVLGGRAYT